MKLFILTIIFVSYSVSADETQSGQISAQIQCYLQKLKAFIPADAVPQDQALIKDAKSVEENIIELNAKGIGQNLKNASIQLATVLPKLKDPKLRALCTQMMAKIKPVESKFESGNGDFKDIFTLNRFLRNSLKKNFGGGCGESTLPEGKSSAVLVVNKIKNQLSKLKASAPANVKPIFDRLAKNIDDALKQSSEFNRKGVLKVLERGKIDAEKLISTMRPGDARQHQMEILAKQNAIIKKFESDAGTFLDIYNFNKFIESRMT